MIPGLGLHTSASCANLATMELGCMACDGAELATGHVQVTGGPHNGRVLLILGPRCLGTTEESATARIKPLLAHYATQGLLSLHDLGPGPKGAPEVQHGDHLDPLPSC
jgi:hypothetical protein